MKNFIWIAIFFTLGYATPIDQVGDKDADVFQCSWGNIPITLRCDGNNNCGDNSDEESCEKEEAKYAKIPSWMSGVSTRIVGGTKAPFPIPWQVHVHINRTDLKGIQGCGGTIIDEKTIISAAHCYYPLSKTTIQFIEAGITKDFSENGQNIKVKDVIIHPSYDDSRTIGKYDNDIAVLMLETPLIFNDNVSPAQLPDPSLNLGNVAGNSDSQLATVSGWGKVRFFRQRTPINLMYVSVPLISIEKCIKPHTVYSSSNITSNMICAGGSVFDGGPLGDACSGDSGGPLIIPKSDTDDTAMLVGIVSFGFRCGRSDAPGVYTRVTEYISWIQSIRKASKVMITSGQGTSARKTKIVDVANGLTCSDMADFPVALYGAVGANLGGTPVVCGGVLLDYSKKCFKFKNSVWEEFASMKEKRAYAAAVMHNDKLHVFGGYSSSSNLQTTETINVDGEVSYGPDLPTGVWRHAMTKINDTVSLLSGGYTHSYSAKTWYYNHDTEVFTSGPDLLEGRRTHGSALNVDKVTKSKIVVVTGGFKNGNRMDSTELLINGQWQTGPPLPKAIYGFSMLEMHGDTYVIGGWDGSAQSSIYQLSCSSGICSWTTLNQQLKVGRQQLVAMPVQDNFCT